MAKFYVGQRVRIKWSNGWPELAGTEGIVNDYYPEGDPAHITRPNSPVYAVAPDVWGSMWGPTAPNGASGFCPIEDQLEPIVDPGRQVITWDACCWVPSHLREIEESTPYTVHPEETTK